MALGPFCLPVLSITGRSAEVSSCNFGFFSFSFQFCQFLLPCVFEALLWEAYILRIVMSSWQINPFIILECPFLSPLVFFVLKSTCRILMEPCQLFCDWCLHDECLRGVSIFSLRWVAIFFVLCMLTNFGLYPEPFECSIIRLCILFKSCGECWCVCLAGIDLVGFRVYVPNSLLWLVVSVSVLCS